MIKLPVKIMLVAILIPTGLASLFFAYYCFQQIIFIPSFFNKPEEIRWANNSNSHKISLEDEPWVKNQTKIISEDDELYSSPSENYRFEYKRHDGFRIIENKTKRIILDSTHWVIHPSEVKWLFDEKYIAYTHIEKDMIGLQREYVYVGCLKTGEIARLTTTTNYSIFVKGSSPLKSMFLFLD